MYEKLLNRTSMLFISICFFYLFFLQYIIGDNKILLFGTAIAAFACMIIDICINAKNYLSIVPWGVTVNLVMCIYSLLVGIVIARDQNALLNSIKTYFAFSLVCIVICYISNVERKYDWLLNLIIMIDVVCSIYIIARGYLYRGYGYVISASQNPNTLAMTTNLGLFSLSYKYSEKKIKTVPFLVLTILFLYIVIGSGSRKGLLASIIIIGICLFQIGHSIWMDGNNQYKALFVIGMVIVIVFAVYYYRNIYTNTLSYNRMLTLGSEDEGSSRDRKEFYALAWEYFCEHPFFGIGLAQFSIWNPIHTYAHSTYAEALANWGTIGCLLYFIPAIMAGKQLAYIYLSNKKSGATLTVFALWVMEIFLGIGQIWFYGMGHMLAWSVIFLYVFFNLEEKSVTERKWKYVKV